MVRRCLVVANQTLGGKALDDAVKDCIARDVRVFYVVVPRTLVEHETTDWSGGFRLGEGEISPEKLRAAMEESGRRHEAALEEARRRAQHRLDLMIGKVQTLGGEADGEVGAENPLEATRRAFGSQPPFDEIIVSTLPSRLSRWLRMDLPNRVARMTDVPVTTIEADELEV